MTHHKLKKAIDKLALIKETTPEEVTKALSNKDAWMWYLVEEVAKSC